MEASKITIRQPRPGELEAVRDLRYQVLDKDKGLPRKTSSDTDEVASSVHMAAFYGNRVVSTVRLNPLVDDPHVYLVRRMATDVEYRGEGIGSRVLRAAEAEAINRGAESFVLHAREKAATFYARAGYEPTGEHVVHDGDVNITMTKRAVHGT